MTTSLLRDVLGCPGSVSGPPNLAEPVRLVLAEIASSWRNRLAGSGTPAAHHLAFHVLASGHISDQASGVCRRTRAGYSVDITLSASIPVPRLRHCLSHELGHVLVNQCVVQGSPYGGLASEYAAERIGWEIALGAAELVRAAWARSARGARHASRGRGARARLGYRRRALGSGERPPHLAAVRWAR